MCKCQWRPELTLGWCSPGVIHLVFWDRIFYWDLDPLILQGWLASGPQSAVSASTALMLQVWIPTDAEDLKSDSHACAVWWFEDVLHSPRLLNTLSSVGDHAWAHLGSVSWLEEVCYWGGSMFRVKTFAYRSFALLLPAWGPGWELSACCSRCLTCHLLPCWTLPITLLSKSKYAPSSVNYPGHSISLQQQKSNSDMLQVLKRLRELLDSSNF